MAAFYSMNDPFGIEDVEQKEANQKAAEDELKAFLQNLNTAKNPWENSYDVLKQNAPLMADYEDTPGHPDTLNTIRSVRWSQEDRQREK